MITAVLTACPLAIFWCQNLLRVSVEVCFVRCACLWPCMVTCAPLFINLASSTTCLLQLRRLCNDDGV